MVALNLKWNVSWRWYHCLHFAATWMNYLRAGHLEPGNAGKSHGKAKAEEMLLQGWNQKCQLSDKAKGHCRVPSASEEGKYWDVDLVRGTCTCPAASQRGMCKHYYIADNLASLGGLDVAAMREAMAKQLHSQEMYVVDGWSDDMHLLVWNPRAS